MQDWNVVITTRNDGYNRALHFLADFSPVYRTQYFNVLLLRVADHASFMEDLLRRWSGEGEEFLARVMPVVQTFVFTTPEEFDAQARSAASAWIPALAGKKFHVRMHRRGFKGKLHAMEEEQFLDGYLLEALKLYGSPARIVYDDADAVLALETVDNRGGMALFTRDDLMKYPFLGRNE